MYYVETKNDFTIINIELENIHVSLLDHGATILDIKTKDIKGTLESVVLKYNDLSEYKENKIYLNTTVGPIAGRIKDATFTLNDIVYELDKNDSENNLHSGSEGLSFKKFSYKIVEEKEETSVIFRYNSTDVDGMYPGNQIYKVIYKVSNSQLTIEYYVETDTDTIINLTNHAYFNLSGNSKRNILNEQVKIDANYYLETDDGNVPFKKIKVDKNVDFRTLTPIKEHLPKLPKTNGIDHQMLLTNPSLDTPSAYLYDDASKRYLEVYTTYPVIVCYTHNYPSDAYLQNNIPQQKNMGICFEAQYESNGINVEELNSAILRKEDRYDETIIFKFGVKEDITWLFTTKHKKHSI